jgi:hypothetical protein
VHENGVGVVELAFVKRGIEGNVSVAEFGEWEFGREVREEVRDTGTGEDG